MNHCREARLNNRSISLQQCSTHQAFRNLNLFDAGGVNVSLVGRNRRDALRFRIGAPTCGKKQENGEHSWQE